MESLIHKTAKKFVNLLVLYAHFAGAEDRKLFVGGLSWETKEPQLKEYFEKFGEIESVNLKLDPVTGRSRCFAFMVFKETSSVDQVLKEKIEQTWTCGKITTYIHCKLK